MEANNTGKASVHFLKTAGLRIKLKQYDALEGLRFEFPREEAFKPKQKQRKLGRVAAIVSWFAQCVRVTFTKIKHRYANTFKET